MLSWSKYTVRTLDAAGLRQAAIELAAMARPFAPDIIIGIRSGGYVVAELMAPCFPQAALLPVTCRRPSTARKQKSSVIKKAVAMLPRAINDRLRIMEHIVLNQLRPPKPVAFTPEADELSAIKDWLAKRDGAVKILMVDDAVDSGATLAAVANILKNLAGSTSIIKAAAITVTTASPLLQPDFFLYRYVLCRFPWSLDAKN